MAWVGDFALPSRKLLQRRCSQSQAAAWIQWGIGIYRRLWHSKCFNVLLDKAPAHQKRSHLLGDIDIFSASPISSLQETDSYFSGHASRDIPKTRKLGVLMELRPFPKSKLQTSRKWRQPSSITYQPTCNKSTSAEFWSPFSSSLQSSMRYFQRTSLSPSLPLTLAVVSSANLSVSLEGKTDLIWGNPQRTRWLKWVFLQLQ